MPFATICHRLMSRTTTVVLLGVFAFLWALYLKNRLAEIPEPATVIDSTDSQELRIAQAPEPELTQSAPAPVLRESERRPDVVVGRPRDRQLTDDLGAGDSVELDWTSTPVFPAPSEVAITAYDPIWRESIEGMHLPDEETVRRVIVDWEQYNLELHDAVRTGDLTIEGLMESLLPLEMLQERLAPYMTPGQIANIATIHEIFSDYVAETSEYADMMLESELEILERVRRE